MKFIILAALCCSASCSTLKNEEADRREGISYSTSVVHSDPNFPDQQAQSSIDFKLETPDYNPKHPRNNGFYQSPKELTKSVYHGVSEPPRSGGFGGYGGNGSPPGDKYFSGGKGLQHDDKYYSSGKPHDFGSGDKYYSTGKNVQYDVTLGDKFYLSGKNTQHELAPGYPVGKSVQHDLPQGDKFYSGDLSSSKDYWAQPTQKSNFRYNQPPIPKGMYPQVYSHPQFASKTKFPSNNKPASGSFPSSSNSQSFNVGYSVKFGAGKPNKNPRLESDVITGSRKEEVGKPIKSQKFIKPTSVGLTSSQILSQSHITPKTQKQLAFLETIQGTSKPPKDFDQLGNGQKNNSPWKSLSPSVEIYKSREVSLSSDFDYNNNQKGYFDGFYDQQRANSDQINSNANHFDHQRALGKSEGFDYTNAVDFSGLSASNVHQFMQPAVYDKQMNKPVTVQGNQYTSSNQLYSFANQANSVKPQTNQNINSLSLQQQNAGIANLNSVNSQQLANTQQLGLTANSQPLGISNAQLGVANFNHQTLNPQALTVTNLNQAKTPIPKLPMDTSLLRDPILTVDKHNLKGDSSKIPIHFDTTLIQEIGKSYGALYNEANGGFDGKDIKLSDTGYKPQDSEKEASKVVQNYDGTLNDQEVKSSSGDYKTIQYETEGFNSQTEAAFNAKPGDFDGSYQFGNKKTPQFGNEQSQNTFGSDQSHKTSQYGSEKNNQFGSQYQNVYNAKTNQFGGEINQFANNDQKIKTNQFENFNEQFENDANPEMKFTFPQNGLFNPSLQKMKSPPKKSQGEYYRLRKPSMYMVNEPVEEAAQQSPAQLKVFSKPANTFMRHEFEKFQKTRTPEKPRQPRINPKRIIRDYNLETDLKPPPLHYNRPRRMHKYETH